MKSHTKYVVLFLLAIGAYAALTLTSPLRETFGLSELQARLLQLTIIIPVAATWAAGFYGTYRIRQYARAVGPGKEQDAFGQLGLGLLVFILGSVAGVLLGAVRPHILDNHNAVAALQVVMNYLNLTAILIGFAFLLSGSRKLLGIVNRGPSRRTGAMLAVMVALIGIIFTAVLFQGQYRNTSPDPATYQSYYLNDPLIILTLVLPYLLAWWLGLKTGANILRYRNLVKGSIYKQGLTRLAIGSVAVIGFSIVLQFFAAASPALQELGLGGILAVLYGLLVLYAAGYLLIASGARQLKHIEEV